MVTLALSCGSPSGPLTAFLSPFPAERRVPWVPHQQPFIFWYLITLHNFLFPSLVPAISSPVR